MSSTSGFSANAFSRDAFAIFVTHTIRIAAHGHMYQRTEHVMQISIEDFLTYFVVIFLHDDIK